MNLMNYGGGEAMDLPRSVFLMQSENGGSLCDGWSLKIYRLSVKVVLFD
jgi:hypothetical protein